MPHHCVWLATMPHHCVWLASMPLCALHPHDYLGTSLVLSHLPVVAPFLQDEVILLITLPLFSMRTSCTNPYPRSGCGHPLPTPAPFQDEEILSTTLCSDDLVRVSPQAPPTPSTGLRHPMCPAKPSRSGHQVRQDGKGDDRSMGWATIGKMARGANR